MLRVINKLYKNFIESVSLTIPYTLFVLSLVKATNFDASTLTLLLLYLAKM